MTLFLRLSALTALAFTLTACETVLDADPTSQITPGASVHAVNHAIYGNPDALKEGRTVDELNTLIRRNFEPLDEIVPGTDTAYMWFFRSERPLAEKDRAAAELLAAHEGIEWLHLRQMVATQLLDLHARNGSDDLDAIERYTAILIDGQWVKATPAFNIELTERFRLKPLDFDGRADSIYHPFDLDGRAHMEYLRFRGEFAEIPVTEMRDDFARLYPAMALVGSADFDADVAAESAPSA